MKKHFKHCIAIGIISALISILFLSSGFLFGTQKAVQDRLYTNRIAPSNIIILAIDDKSIQEIGRFPWDRTVYADALGKLNKSIVVGIDVIFSENSTKKSDETLAKAIAANGNVVLATEVINFAKIKNTYDATQILEPLPIFAKSARGMGIINLNTDSDGVVRSANTKINSKYKLFALEIASKIVGVSAPIKNELLINYFGGPQTYKTISVSDLLNDKVGIEEFTNKIVLIGATAPDLHDDHLVPTSKKQKVPGVEVQATLVNQILTKQHLSYQPSWQTILLILLGALLISLLMIRFNVWLVAGSGLAIIGAYYLFAIFMFSKGIISDMVYLPLAMILSYVGNLAHLYLGEQKEKREVLNAWSKYVAPSVVADLRRNPEKLKLGGERREVTIFFSDVRGFTALSEKLTAEQLVALLNEYLTAMTDIIMEYDGIVDKYIGDAIMAIWGAPLDQPDHAQRSVDATIAMNNKLAELNKKWAKEGVPQLKIGSGMHTGNAVIGNMGSHQRFDYTAMGDTVNLASRLEGLTKPYAVLIIVSESLRKKLPKNYVCRELDLVAVKGRQKPITIYEVVAKKEDITPNQKMIKENYEEGLKLYRQTKFKEAIKEFKKAKKLGDRTSIVFIDRSEYFIGNHPGKKWDGVWVMKTK